MTRSRDVADTQDNLGGAVAPFVAGKNAVINGGFDNWQRGTSFTATSSAIYTADRWQGFFGTATTATFSRQATSDSTNLPSIQYCARIQRNNGSTTAAQLNYFYSMESANSIPFAGKTVTFSFYARVGANFSAASNEFGLAFTTGTGTDQSVVTGFTGASTGYGGFTGTTTWQRFTYTRTIATTSTQIGWFFYYNATGTASAADYLEITGVQLEIGSTATPFARAGGSIGGELALCQRYYYRQGGASLYQQFGTGVAGASNGTVSNIVFPVSMRTAPTSVDYSTIGLQDGVNSIVSVSSLTLTGAAQQGNNNGAVSTAASGLTLYRFYYLIANNSTSAYIGFSAEL
jgi:hypothetical protein